MKPKPTDKPPAPGNARAAIITRTQPSHTSAFRPKRAWERFSRRPGTSTRGTSASREAFSGRRLWGYGCALAGTALATLIIAAIPHHETIGSISLVYLFVVIWLAVRFGRGPAVGASFLAILAYDFFFIPPLYVFTVNQVSGWVSLFALLATSLVIGQLTAALQARTREAEASSKRTEALYALARLVVETRDEEQLYRELVARAVVEFASHGVAACVLLIPNDQQEFVMGASAPEGDPLLAGLSLTERENAGKVAWVFEHASPVGGQAPSGKDQTRGTVRYYIPLTTGHRCVGVLGIAGSPEIRRLAQIATPTAHTSIEESLYDEALDMRSQQAALFGAFCNQIALVLERAALQRRAIHNEALMESDRLKSTLLGSVTHDLRTPLASIKAAATSLLQPDARWSDGEQQELLTLIDASTDRLDRLVGNLLDLSRLEAGAAEPVKDWYLINDVIATVLDRLELTGVTKRHRIIVSSPDDLPIVPLDYAQIEQVLTNLIENAVKYSPAGGEIRVEALARDERVLEVRVSDQGIGIPGDELDAIFDKFYRVLHVRLPWQTERPPLGTGLGLAICKGIIGAHGGRIWAESEPGKGSVFIFTLPIPADRPQGKLPDLADTEEKTPAPTPGVPETADHQEAPT